MKKAVFKKILAGLLMAVVAVSSTTVLCFAEQNPLDEIGGSTSVQQSVIQQTTTPTVTDEATSTTPALNIDEGKISDSNKEAAEGVGEIFKQGALTKESVEKSKKIVEPIARLLNLLMAILLGLLSAAIVLVSVFDLVYIQIPASRNLLAPNRNIPQMGMQHNKGQAGTHGQTGANAQTGTAQTQTQTPTPPAGRQWVSDEAIAALNESQAQQPQMATPMMGQQQPKAGGRNAIITYMKKRTLTLIVLGVCVVMFTCTVFTDIGVLIGMKLIALLSGL